MSDNPRPVRILSTIIKGMSTELPDREEAIKTVALGGWTFPEGETFSLQEERFYAALTDPARAWARSHGRWPKLSDFSFIP